MKLWQKLVSGLALLFVALVGLGVMLYDNLNVVGSNMHPTLVVGDTFTVRSGQAPTVNDVIVFQPPERVGATTGGLVSRLVAVGGQEVSFANGQLFIDGVLIAEPFLWEANSTEPRNQIPGCAQPTPAIDRCVIPEGHGFVMGDNRRGSADSRVYGPIDLAMVDGVVTEPPWWLFAGLLP